jgi:hypothetical protein
LKFPLKSFDWSKSDFEIIVSKVGRDFPDFRISYIIIEIIFYVSDAAVDIPGGPLSEHLYCTVRQVTDKAC